MTLLSVLRRRWRPLVLTLVYVETLYALSNWQTLRAAHFLPLTAVDRALPLLPWTVLIYLTVYFIPLLPCVLPEDDRDILGLAAAFAAMDTFCTAAFLAYPTTYPRPTDVGGGWAGWAMTVVQRLDTPRNCCPSQHVANAVLAALLLWRYDRRACAAALLWAAAICVSTLTTKQHYAWDVAAGIAVAVVTAAGYAWAARRPALSLAPAGAAARDLAAVAGERAA